MSGNALESLCGSRSTGRRPGAGRLHARIQHCRHADRHRSRIHPGLIYAGFAQLAFLWTGVELNDLYNAVATSQSHNAVSHLINVFAEAVGGYWAAKLARHRPIPHAAVAGFLMLVPAAAAFLVPYDFPHPAWSLALMFVTPVPAAILGALWWRRRGPISTSA